MRSQQSGPQPMIAIKICGLTNAQSLHAACQAGADFVGLVFYPQSPRHLTLEAAQILSQIPRGTTQLVALTVNADDQFLSIMAEKIKPDFIQAHGEETPKHIASIKKRTGCKIIKALKISKAEDLRAVKLYHNIADIILFDAAPLNIQLDTLPGGNGLQFDWHILASYQPKNFMLAGGLTPHNVAQALSISGAEMVDVSSGVEKSIGVKDIGLMRQFIQAARYS